MAYQERVRALEQALHLQVSCLCCTPHDQNGAALFQNTASITQSLSPFMNVRVCICLRVQPLCFTSASLLLSRLLFHGRVYVLVGTASLF